MAADERWYFTKEQLQSSPSQKCGIDADKELSYRQQAANFIQDMGQRLPVNQLCINTAIVYMHRFYMFHSFTKFHRNAISTCALFLAAKVEEQPRKLEHVIKVAHMCLNKGPAMDPKTEAYLEQAQQLVMNENIMLQTLGFDVAIDHPHTHIVKCCQLVRASKDLAQTSYIMATNSLHLTTMCLQYKPTIVACVCIHLACKWANWEIPYSSEGKDWFWYVEKYITLELLEELTTEFLAILDKCPSRLNKRKILNASKEMVPDKKGKMDVNCYESSIPLALVVPNSEKNRSPMPPGKQEKSDRSDRLDRVNKAERFDRMDRIDKNNDWAESSTSDKLDRSEKQNRTERQDKMIKLEQTERYERHERLEKSEKEKLDRVLERERSERQIKTVKVDHPMRIEHSDKMNEPKEIKSEASVTSCHSTSSGSHLANVTSIQNPLKLPGFIPSTSETKMSASNDGNNISVPAVSKKHRYNASKQPCAKEHREHKERKEKQQIIDKERPAQLPNFHSVQSNTPPPQSIRQEKLRHKKEDITAAKLMDAVNINNQCDARVPPVTNVSIPQEKLKDFSIKNQTTHQNEHKQHSEPKQRSKHIVCPHEKNMNLNEIKSEPSSEDDQKLSNAMLCNEPKKIKPAGSEGKINSSMVKSEKTSMHPRINQQIMTQDKHLQEGLNKISEQPPISLPPGYLHSHTQQISSQSPVTATLSEKSNIVSEKHERHERKEKHKHKDKDREKTKEKRESLTTEAQETPLPSQPAATVTSQRIKLTIPKERLNSKPTNSSDGNRKKVSPPKDTPIKLKISKERLTATPAQKKSSAGVGDIPKLKIKIPKDPALFAGNKGEKSESRKRERDSPKSPKNLNLKNSPKSSKIPRIETRSSRKDDSSTASTQSLLSLPMPPEPMPSNSRSSKSEPPSKANGNNTASSSSSFTHFSRKSGSSSKVNDNYKNKSSHVMKAYQQIQMNAGPYPYAQYYPYSTPISGYFAHPPPPTGDFHAFHAYGQNFHMGPPLPPPPPDHGPPPLPREPPPPTPPPPPE